MGAAAVFEMAAETPPTVEKMLATATALIHLQCHCRGAREGKPTQEVDHEALYEINISLVLSK